MSLAQQGIRLQQMTPQACLVDFTPPSGGVVSSVTNNADGSAKAQWGAASDTNGPITYEVYVQKASAAGIFALTPFLSRGLSMDLTKDSAGNAIVQGDVVHVGVRAVDALGNRNSNTATLSVTISGVNYASLLSILPGAVWDVLRSLHSIAGSFGEALDQKVSDKLNTSAYTAPDNASIAAIKAKTDQFSFTSGNVNSIAQVVADKTGYTLTAGERTAIATAVEAALLNDGDGQALINAIVAAIGNQNIDQVLLVAAVRADIERAGGLLDTKASQTSVTAIKAKTDNLPSDPASQGALNTTLATLETDAAAETRKAAVLAAIGSNPTAAAIADAVWDEPIAGHVAAGSTGELLQQNAPPTVQQIVDGVWDETLADHLDIGSTGKQLASTLANSNFIPAGQQVEVEIGSPDQIEVEVEDT